jgi:hypothetical protein
MSNFLSASDLSRRLARHAEAVCRHYLRAGRKQGRYWLVGDIMGSPGRSLYVRLSGPDSGKGAAGKWTEHVAARVMLRIRDLALSCGRSPGSTQHNVSSWRGIS